jgi:outer membrane protein TolC
MTGLMLLATLVLAGSKAAQDTVPLSLQDAEARAAAANPSLRAARLDALAAGKRTAETFGRHFGELDAVGVYNHYESDRSVRPIALDLLKNPALGFAQLPWDRNQVHFGVTWQIPLLAAGTLHEGDQVARLSQSASEHVAAFTQEQILYNVRAAYRNALIAEHALAAARAYQEALTRDSADADLKARLGTWAPVDLAKVTFALLGAEAQSADLQAQRRTAQAYLAALMGELPPPEGFALVDVPGQPAQVAETSAAMVNAALASRSDLLAVREGTSIFEHRKRLSLEAFAPQVLLQGNYLVNDAPSLSHPLDTYEVNLMVKVPIFTGLSRIAAVGEADANLEAARQRERAKELEVAAQVVDARGRLTSAQALLQAGAAQRNLGAEVARVEHLRLEQGTGNMEDYLAARGQELAGETAYWRGLYTYQSALDYMDFVSARGDSHE